MAYSNTQHICSSLAPDLAIAMASDAELWTCANLISSSDAAVFSSDSDFDHAASFASEPSIDEVAQGQSCCPKLAA